jgi:endonuclease/exonuclease/phosphatase family metal-dependent hydrolase
MRTLRVATYNLYLGADLSLVFGATSQEDLARRARAVYEQMLGTDFPARARAIAGLLAREKVDVVGLQEVSLWARSTPGSAQPVVWCDFLDELTEALAAAGHPCSVHAANVNFSGAVTVENGEAMSVVGHNVTLVRRDAGVEVVASGTGEYRATLEVQAPMEGLRFRVPRSWGWLDGAVDGTRFRFVNTHTEAYDAQVRDAQRDELLQEMRSTALPVVLAGDFNASPAEVGMPEGWADAWLAAGNADPGYTVGQSPDLANPQSTLRRRIDYLWVRDATVQGCWLVGDQPADRTGEHRLWPSDHACVVADIAFRPGLLT